MYQDVIFAGFGGQGVMLIGQLLANAAMLAGYETIWMPSYGPEMRGGTANCTVVISDSPIGSPVVPNPKAAVVLNRPSMDKFEPMVEPGGTLIVNSSLIDRKANRTDIRVVYVDANKLAEQRLGNSKAANMIMLGAYLHATGAVSPETVKDTMVKKMKGKERFLEMNRFAIDIGIEVAKQQC